MLRTLAVGISVVSLSCHGGGDLTPSSFVAESTSAVCSYEVRCGAWPDQASCLLFAEPDTAVGSALDELVGEGKTAFDPASAQACLDAEAALPCDQTAMALRVEPVACKAVLVGTGSDGAACENNAECASSVCKITDCSQTCCPGTCQPAQPPGQVGQACTEDSCDVGLYCQNETTCEPLGGSGATCANTGDCAYGLGCAADTCEPLPKVGEACPQEICEDLGVVCNAIGICEQIEPPGSACTAAEDCSPIATCDETTLKCTTLPTLGQPCSFGCSDGSYCNVPDGGSGTGTCIALGANGATCTQDLQCATRYCGDNGACADEQICI